jgi:hypothetical protein
VPITAPHDLRVTWPPPLPPIDGRYPYFDALATHQNRLASYSLRTQAQLLTYMDQPNPAVRPWDVTYDPAHDPDPRRQDGAKILIPAGKVSLPNNVRVPIPDHTGTSLFAVWDVWYGNEFRFQFTGIANYKTFQFASGRIWTEIKDDWDYPVQHPEFSRYLSQRQVRYYGSKRNGEWGANVIHNHPLSPFTSVGVLPEVWTRNFAYFRPTGTFGTIADYSEPAEWWEFSLWFADETRDPIQVNDRCLIMPNYPSGLKRWDKFWLEYNSSTARPLPTLPARVSYVRNIAMLKGLQPADLPALLERPQG